MSSFAHLFRSPHLWVFRLLTITVGVLLASTAIHVVLESQPRYHYVMVLGLILICTYGIQHLSRAFRRKEDRANIQFLDA